LLSGGVEIDATPYLWDLGLVHLATPVKNCTPVELGAFAPSDLKQFQFLIPGYPGDKAAGTMWGGTGKLMSVDDELLFYGISTYNGQSGASLLVQAKNG